MTLDKVLLIDGHNFAWRANIVFKPFKKEVASPAIDCWGFTNPPPQDDKPSDEFVMVFNFFRNLRVLIQQFEPIKVFFCLEGHPQFRYDLCADYKANRIIKTGSALESHERFDKCLPEILRLIKHLPITTIKAEKYEADDAIATLVENMSGEEVIIVSGDSDFIQVLQKGYPNVRLYHPIKKDFITAPEYHYLAWKSLAGDKSDNIKGLVGDKTAQKLLKDPEKFKIFLDKEENRANFNINKELIEFRSVPLEDMIVEQGMTNFEFLRQEFTKLEFKSMIKEPYWSSFEETFECLKY